MTDDEKKARIKEETNRPEKLRNEPETANDALSGEVEIQPTLVGYFSEARASPSAFFKIIRKNEVKYFLREDKEAAAHLMSIQDPEAERLWGLMSQSMLPEPVDAWIWGAAQSRLSEQLSEAFNPQDIDAGRIFKSIVTELSAGLSSEKKEEKKRAETLLRLAICWLMEKRSLKAWQVAEQLRLVFFSDLKAATRLAQQALQKGKANELRLIAAMAALGDQMVKDAEEDRRLDRNISTELRQRLDEANRKIEKLGLDLEHARKTISDHQATIKKLEETIVAEKHQWGHNLSETKTKQKVLLGERLGPLLEDAIDALEIETPALGTALRRVKAALSVIKEANE